MKKIIAIGALFLGFSFNSNAQETASAKNAKTETKQEVTTKSIENNIADLDRVVKLNESLKHDLTKLLYMREEALNEFKTEADKKAVYERFNKKFLGGLTADQIELLKGNKELYDRLTQYPVK